MRVISWNMAYWKRRKHWREAWAFLVDELAPDIALLQEAVVPEGLDYEQFVTTALEVGTSLKELDWGAAILSRVGTPKQSMRISPELIARRGAVQVASCDIDGIGTTTLVNIHSRLNYHAVQQVIPNLQETIDMILPALGPRFIVGGDFNTGRVMGVVYEARYGHAAFWKGIDSSVLREALPGENEERQSYWGHEEGPTAGKLQDDHIFLDGETHNLPWECYIEDSQHIRVLSDHGPVVVDIPV